jgi:hypothetical protein
MPVDRIDLQNDHQTNFTEYRIFLQLSFHHDLRITAVVSTEGADQKNAILGIF